MRTGISMIALAGVLAGWGCASSPKIAPTHREDLAAQSRVLAMAAGSLEASVQRHRAAADEEKAARDVAAFRQAAENFAQMAGVWRDNDQVNKAWTRLIERYVDMKDAFPELNADSLTTDAYRKVAYEWEQTRRATGYAGRKYQEKLEAQRRVPEIR